MSTTLGGQTLADPSWERDGYERGANDIGAFHELVNGSIVYDYVDQRDHFVLRWRAITATERNTIRTRYDVKTVQAFSPPDSAGSINVLVVPGSYHEDYTEIGGVLRYYVQIELEEAP